MTDIQGVAPGELALTRMRATVALTAAKAFTGIQCVAASMAELASSMPTSGGCELSSDKIVNASLI